MGNFVKPQNLVIVLSDQHDPRYMGCSGHALVHTPHMDALARRGTRFVNAYTPSPICVPARAALATGRPIHETGYWDNAMAYEGRWTSWHHRLGHAGVRVESIGKLHYRSETDPTGFLQQHEALHIHQGVGLVWGSVRDPLPETRGDSPIFEGLGPGESSYNRHDLRVAAAARSWLQARAQEGGDRPWVLQLGFVAPHMPYMVPPAFLERYPLSAMPDGKLRPVSGHRRHPWVERMARHWDHDRALADDQERALVKACYLGLVSFMDQQLGQVLKALDETGLSSSTAVLYLSDHGDNLGARGMWNKSTLYRESVGVPMILAGPGLPQGQVRHTSVSLLDVYPTVLDWVGVPRVPEESGLSGESLAALACGDERLDRLVLSEYHAVGAESAAFMLANSRYKYHHYEGYPSELFDIVDDPEEACDLSGLASHATVCRGLDQALRDRLDPQEVDRRAKREQNALVARFGGREGALRQGNPGPTPIQDRPAAAPSQALAVH